MTRILTTGEVADLLSRCGDRRIIETQLSHAIRKARIALPPVSAGRRLWERRHILSAATHFGVDAGVVLHALEQEGR